MSSKIRAPFKYYLWIAILFAVSRIIYFISGRYVSAGPLSCGYYTAPLSLLRDRLLETVYYFHVSPPLYNLFIGLLVKVFPRAAYEAHLIISHIVGLIICFGLFTLLIRFKVPLVPAIVLTSLFVFSPGLVIYETIPGYTLYCCVLLLQAALFLHRYLQEGGAGKAAVYFLLLAGLVLLRGTFNLIWFVAFILIPFFATGINRKRLFMALVVPCLLVLGWHIQQIWVFGYPPGSFILGKQLMEIAAFGIPSEVLEKISNSSDGELITISDYRVPLPNEVEKIIGSGSPTGIPVLDWKFWEGETGVIPNYGYSPYLHLGRRWQKEAIRIIFRFPGYFARNVVASAQQYFQPAEDILYFEDPQTRSPIERTYEIIYGRIAPFKPGIAGEGRGEIAADRRTAWILVIGLPFLFLYGCWAAYRRFPGDKPMALTLIFMLGSIFWVTLAMFMLSVGESMRYRFEVDPFFIVLFGLFISDIRSLARRLCFRQGPKRDLPSRVNTGNRSQ